MDVADVCDRLIMLHSSFLFQVRDVDGSRKDLFILEKMPQTSDGGGEESQQNFVAPRNPHTINHIPPSSMVRQPLHHPSFKNNHYYHHNNMVSNVRPSFYPNNAPAQAMQQHSGGMACGSMPLTPANSGAMVPCIPPQNAINCGAMPSQNNMMPQQNMPPLINNGAAMPMQQGLYSVDNFSGAMSPQQQMKMAPMHAANNPNAYIHPGNNYHMTPMNGNNSSGGDFQQQQQMLYHQQQMHHHQHRQMYFNQQQMMMSHQVPGMYRSTLPMDGGSNNQFAAANANNNSAGVVLTGCQQSSVEVIPASSGGKYQSISRCESARSDAAESTCSTLSSDSNSQQDLQQHAMHVRPNSSQGMVGGANQQLTGTDHLQTASNYQQAPSKQGQFEQTKQQNAPHQHPLNPNQQQTSTIQPNLPTNQVHLSSNVVQVSCNSQQATTVSQASTNHNQIPNQSQITQNQLKIIPNQPLQVVSNNQEQAPHTPTQAASNQQQFAPNMQILASQQTQMIPNQHQFVATQQQLVMSHQVRPNQQHPILANHQLVVPNQHQFIVSHQPISYNQQQQQLMTANQVQVVTSQKSQVSPNQQVLLPNQHQMPEQNSAIEQQKMMHPQLMGKNAVSIQGQQNQLQLVSSCAPNITQPQQAMPATSSSLLTKSDPDSNGTSLSESEASHRTPECRAQQDTPDGNPPMKMLVKTEHDADIGQIKTSNIPIHPAGQNTLNQNTMQAVSSCNVQVNQHIQQHSTPSQMVSQPQLLKGNQTQQQQMVANQESHPVQQMNLIQHVNQQVLPQGQQMVSLQQQQLPNHQAMNQQQVYQQQPKTELMSGKMVAMASQTQGSAQLVHIQQQQFIQNQSSLPPPAQKKEVPNKSESFELKNVKSEPSESCSDTPHATANFSKSVANPSSHSCTPTSSDASKSNSPSTSSFSNSPKLSQLNSQVSPRMQINNANASAVCESNFGSVLSTNNANNVIIENCDSVKSITKNTSVSERNIHHNNSVSSQPCINNSIGDSVSKPEPNKDAVSSKQDGCGFNNSVISEPSNAAGAPNTLGAREEAPKGPLTAAKEHSSPPSMVVVPFGWRRIVSAQKVTYIRYVALTQNIFMPPP